MAAYIDMELAGRGNGWTQIADVLANTIEFSRGFSGGMFTDCLMDAGTLTFELNNSELNSGHVVGYYSPGHASCRTGFQTSIWVRLRVVIGSTTFYRFTGILDEVNPVPGKWQNRRTSCKVVTWTEMASYMRLSELPVQINKRADEVLDTLLTGIPSLTRPRAVQKDTGKDTFPYTLDRLRDEQTVMREELYRLCLSGLDKIWERGDGTLVYEARSKRFSTTASIDTFNDSHGFSPTLSRASVINSSQVTVNPRVIGSVGSTLFELARVTPIAPGETVTILGPWTDASNPDIRVGAVDLVTAVSGTDYRVNSLEDGTGTDLLPFTTVTPTLSGNATSFAFTLAATAPSSGFVTYVRQRGTPLLTYNPPVLAEEDAASVLLNGVRSFSTSLPYQDSLVLGKEAAQYVVFTKKAAKMAVAGFTRIIAVASTTEVLRSLQRELSDRITITDEVTGLNAAFFIDNIRESYSENRITTSWGVSPADSTSYFRLDDSVRDKLDAGNRLNFGYLLGHTDVAHGDDHGDLLHGDASHTDTAHTDSAAVSYPHGDGAGHSDDPFIDTPHGDSSHTDVSHSDTHSDTAHTDVAHDDAHYDTPHGDYTDPDPFVGHEDIPHDDDHFDTSHSDTAHSDTHSDVAHTDVGHSDSAHVDEAHEDDSSHADYAHGDALHGDVAHTDTAHSDAAHSDFHSDAEHGDVN